MSKIHTVHRCGACGSCQPRWSGRCCACGEWNTLSEEAAASVDVAALSRLAGGRAGEPRSLGGLGLMPGLGSPEAVALPLCDVGTDGHPPIPTGLDELDRVLSGGLLPGSVTLLGGEPGTGKSTLLLQALASMAGRGRRCLLVAAEEAAHQVKRRASRLNADAPDLFVVEATLLPQVEAAVAQLAPEVVVIDSIQALSDPEISSPAGSVGQVRGCSLSLSAMAKAAGAALVLVGHVTKDGALAGPRALEHLVDTVLSFEGDRYLSLRALRAVKHRFGPAGETGLFEMGERGLQEVSDPSSLFLCDRLPGAAGSAVAVPIEGYRPVLVEVQALVYRTAQLPRRYVSGADAARVGFLLAVLGARAGIRLGDCDVYVSVAGGARATEPATDLAICLALCSSVSGLPVPADLVAVGEVGLGGEVRRVSRMAARLSEAGRMGFSRAVVHPAHPASDLVHLQAPTLRKALLLAFEGRLDIELRGTRGPSVRPAGQLHGPGPKKHS